MFNMFAEIFTFAFLSKCVPAGPRVLSEFEQIKEHLSKQMLYKVNIQTKTAIRCKYEYEFVL